MKTQAKDIKDQRFGRLVAQSVALKKKRGGGAYWSCLCDCGNTKVVRADSLRSGAIRSCGCLHREQAAATGRKSTTHGMSKTKFYGVWAAMLRRCENSSTMPFRYYGGRGIKVCARWHSFENFLADMGIPEAGMEIERIDNDGHYEPSNCRWATRQDQMQNTRGTRIIEFRGQRKSVSAWARDLGMPMGTLWNRIAVCGWSVEEALTTPTIRSKEWT
jgi:hypothetical protein